MFVVSRVGSLFMFFFQAEDGIRDLVRSRGLGDVYKRQGLQGSGRTALAQAIFGVEPFQAGAMEFEGRAGAESFLRELACREFAFHLMHHYPQITHANWKPEWDSFPWRGDSPDAERWRRGMTGERFVDAAMREMYVTGTMHNRARMIAASYLTKHLLTHWKVGLDWFADCLTDWDPAANAMGWQWVAGCGPDAAPYFRVFTPDGPAERIDLGGTSRRRRVRAT